MAHTSLEAGIRMLQENRDDGARVLATHAVSVLKDILIENAENSSNGEDLWLSLRRAGWKLRCARPSMQPAISSALVQALIRVREAWDEQIPGSSWMSGLEKDDMALLVDSGSCSLLSTIDNRTRSAEGLARNFTAWFSSRTRERQRPLRILTLSYSSSLMVCLKAAFHETPDSKLDLRLIESRPRCEGATFAIALSNAISEGNGDGRWSLSVATDSSVAMLSRNVDVVLLGADCISSSGDVSNKMGSLAAVLCAKALSPGCQTTIVAESDKIKPGLMDMSAEEENDSDEISKIWVSSLPAADSISRDIHIRNVYFEWVPGHLVDLYINELGHFSKPNVQNAAAEAEERERQIFDYIVTSVSSEEEVSEAT